MLKEDKNTKELIKLGFPEYLLLSPELSQKCLNHCKKNDMKFLKGSYGTLVHKDFNKYFKTSRSTLIEHRLKGIDKHGKSISDIAFDHSNLFKYKGYDNVYVLTSSTYGELDYEMHDILKDYPYSVYVINPYFLDYYIFHEVQKRHPLYDVNYMFTNADDITIQCINRDIRDGLDIHNTFVKIR